MKTSRNTTNQQSKQGMSKKPRPEIRDNLDSRENKQGNNDQKQKSNKGDTKKG